MKSGYWIPISKGLAQFLPSDRSYSEVEAAFSLQLDFDNQNRVSLAGYAKLWGWSTKRVRNFLKKLGAEISYPENTSKKQNQRGQIKGTDRELIGNRYGTDRELMRFINYNSLAGDRNRSGTDKEQIGDRSGTATRDPNPFKNIYTLIFCFWNEQKIVVHRKINSKDETAIRSALKEFEIEDILDAFELYKKVLNSANHYFTHKWPLRDFLNRGLRKFIPGADPLNNFLSDKHKKGEIETPGPRKVQRCKKCNKKEAVYDGLCLECFGPTTGPPLGFFDALSRAEKSMEFPEEDLEARKAELQEQAKRLRK